MAENATIFVDGPTKKKEPTYLQGYNQDATEKNGIHCVYKILPPYTLLRIC